MNISMKRKKGCITVRGGNAVRVTKTHAVDVTGWSTVIRAECAAGQRPERWPDGEPERVFAEPGDLAIEIRRKRGGDVLGYSYISGAALQLNSYEASSEWFEEAKGSRFTVPLLDLRLPFTEAVEPLCVALVKAKYCGDDIAVFRYRCRKGEDASRVSSWLLRIFSSYGVVDKDEQERVDLRGHVLGVVESHGMRKRNGGGGADLHFQPPCDASDHYATSFQVALALSAFR